MINLNDWAKSITEKEGKKVNLSIAQVKEVMKIIFRDLKGMPLGDINDLLKRIK